MNKLDTVRGSIEVTVENGRTITYHDTTLRIALARTAMTHRTCQPPLPMDHFCWSRNVLAELGDYTFVSKDMLTARLLDRGRAFSCPID